MAAWQADIITHAFRCDSSLQELAIMTIFAQSSFCKAPSTSTQRRVCMVAVVQDVKEDTSLMTDDDDDEEIEDLDAMATGMASGRPGPTPKAASAAETTANAGDVHVAA